MNKFQKFYSETVNSRLLMRGLGALAPALAFFIILFQVYSSANEDLILEAGGVRKIEDQAWTATGIFQDPNSKDLKPGGFINNILLPKGDPLASKNESFLGAKFVEYRTSISSLSTQNLANPLLYLPGIKAEQIEIRVNLHDIIRSQGDLPFFVSLEPYTSNQIEIRVYPKKGIQFQGFIHQDLFVGDKTEVYKTHHRLSFRSFPRQATIIFLLATAALTFAFFLFLDQKRELFALGLSLSTLGLAEAIRVGLIPFLGTRHYFILFTFHVLFLAWYSFELSRLRLKIRDAAIAFTSVVALYFISLYFNKEIGSGFRFGLLQVLNGIPIVLGILVAIRTWKSQIKLEGKYFIYAGAVAMVLYGMYLLAVDLENVLPFNFKDVNQIPVMVATMTWMIAAIASLGSLERRVELAVEDRQRRLQLETELALAQEVQESFIKVGVQHSDEYEVRTIYKAAKTVGGDWIAWRELGSGYGLAVIGDIVGKGMQAGLIVSACDAALQNALGSIDVNKDAPQDILKTVIKSLYRAVIEKHPRRAMTAIFILADKDANLHITSLGHPPLLGFSPRESRVVITHNPWLSAGLDIDKIKFATVSTEEDEILVAYTDGVCDGSKQVKQFQRKLNTWIGRPMAEWEEEFSKLTPDYDDQTVFLIRYRGDRRKLRRAI